MSQVTQYGDRHAARFSALRQSLSLDGSSRVIAGWPRVAGLTHRVGFVGLMATDAACHAGDRRSLRHLIQLAHLPMTVRTLQGRLKMLAVVPSDARSHLIDSHPGDWLAGFRELGEFDNRRPILCDIVVAAHASRNRWKGHLIAGFWICVALPALESAHDMSFVAERQRLRRRAMLGEIFGDFELRSSSVCSRSASGRLLSVQRESEK